MIFSSVSCLTSRSLLEATVVEAEEAVEAGTATGVSNWSFEPRELPVLRLCRVVKPEVTGTTMGGVATIGLASGTTLGRGEDLGCTPGASSLPVST